MRKIIKGAILGTIFLMIGLGSTPVLATHSCGDVITTSTKLDGNLNCVNGPGLIVGADGVTIQLKGNTIMCAGTGFLGSCQGVAAAIGIDTGGFSNVLIKGPGTIDGFHIGVLVSNGSNVNVKQLDVTGPASLGAGVNPRPFGATGILVTGTVCPDPIESIIRIGGNDASNFLEGIKLVNANCVNVGKNRVHDNDSDPVECHGILAINSANNNFNNNSVFANGENAGRDGGLTIRGSSSSGNTVVGNDVSGNCGDGISLRSGASGNVVINNEARGNPDDGVPTGLEKCFAIGGNAINFSDLTDLTVAGANTWNNNNQCNTQHGVVPTGVCNPLE